MQRRQIRRGCRSPRFGRSRSHPFLLALAARSRYRDAAEDAVAGNASAIRLLERRAVDAVPHPGWPRTVGEDVAEVAAARAADDLDAAHAVRVVASQVGVDNLFAHVTRVCGPRAHRLEHRDCELTQILSTEVDDGFDHALTIARCSTDCAITSRATVAL